MKKYSFFIIVLLFLNIAVKIASAGEILAWKDCVKEALANHPDLVSAKEELNQARADKAITVSNFLPQITSEASGKTSETDTAASSKKTDAYAYSITGKQLLFDGFKTIHDINAAAKNITSSEYNYMVISSNVRLRLKTAFSELLKAQELLDITENIAQRRKRNLNLVQLRYDAGREHKGSLLTARADSAQAEFEVAQAERSVSLAQRKLTKELGREKLKPIAVKGNFEITDSDMKKPDFESLSDNTPFLKALIAKKESALLGLQSAKADFLPQVYASASAGRTASYWPPDKDEWSAGAALSFPIFEGGSRIAKASKAKAVFRQAEADERSGRDDVILTMEQAWIELQNALDKVSVQEKFLDAGEERAKISQAQYSTGLISFDNWTIIENDLVQVKKSFLDAQADALIKQAYWIQAKGEILDEE